MVKTINYENYFGRLGLDLPSADKSRYERKQGIRIIYKISDLEDDFQKNNAFKVYSDVKDQEMLMKIPDHRSLFCGYSRLSGQQTRRIKRDQNIINS